MQHEEEASRLVNLPGMAGQTCTVWAQKYSFGRWWEV